MTTKTTEEAVAEVWQLFRETDAKFKETDAKFKETDAKFKETDARMERGFRRLEGLFGNQWGRLLEALVEPGVLKLFQTRGIPVHTLARRVLGHDNGDNMEIDLLLENTDAAIAVEVKSQLTIEFINDFLTDMADFYRFFPKYKGYRLYGAVAGLDLSLDIIRYATRRGLFVLSVNGNDTVRLLNDVTFAPRDFGQ
jgi:hypothetical protein